jgi:hypothetical protein
MAHIRVTPRTRGTRVLANSEPSLLATRGCTPKALAWRDSRKNPMLSKPRAEGDRSDAVPLNLASYTSDHTAMN